MKQVLGLPKVKGQSQIIDDVIFAGKFNATMLGKFTKIKKFDSQRHAAIGGARKLHVGNESVSGIILSYSNNWIAEVKSGLSITVQKAESASFSTGDRFTVLDGVAVPLADNPDGQILGTVKGTDIDGIITDFDEATGERVTIPNCIMVDFSII